MICPSSSMATLSTGGPPIRNTLPVAISCLTNGIIGGLRGASMPDSTARSTSLPRGLPSSPRPITRRKISRALRAECDHDARLQTREAPHPARQTWRSSVLFVHAVRRLPASRRHRHIARGPVVRTNASTFGCQSGGQLLQFGFDQHARQIVRRPLEIFVQALAKQRPFSRSQGSPASDPWSLLVRILRADRPHRVRPGPPVRPALRDRS